MAGVKGFQSGANWRGNSNGRPKKPNFRDTFTEEFFKTNGIRVSNILKMIFEEAEERKPWAMKLIADYSLTRPKTPEPEEDTDNNELIERLANKVKNAKLVELYDTLAEEIENE